VQVEFNTNDEPVTLRFEHVGQHPVWRGPADSAAFLQAVADNTANPRGYNWAEVINHAMTNWYSYGIKLQYFRDTGLTEGRGTWMCGKLTFNGLEPLFDIVQQSVHQADPFGYVYAQVRGLDYDDPDDEEAGDYPDASPVNDPLAQATYLSLLMFAERYGALQNGFHLRTLTHIYANSLQDHLGVGLGKLEADQVHGADITAIIAVHQSQRNERVGYSARCKRIAASTSRGFSAASRPSGLPMMRSFAMVRICWAWALESLGRPASARDRATSKG
jgi:hypothetical protein